MQFMISSLIESTDEENKELLQELMKNYGEDVLRTAYFFTKNASAIDDIFQEVYIKVYRNIGKFRGDANIKTWILRITINQCRDYLKSFWVKRVLSSFEFHNGNAGHNASIDDHLILAEEKHELLTNILELPLSMREVIILHYYHNLNESDISSMLKIAKGTVRSRLFRAKTLLKTKMDKREE